MELSVIISSSNHDTDCLHKVLTGFATQKFKDFELILAGIPQKEAQELLAPFSKCFTSIKCIDPNINTAALLNQAIRISEAEYLVFTRSNCIPRQDFLAIHADRKEQSYFLSGGHFKLPPHVYQQMEAQHIESQCCFQSRWLRLRGLPFSLKNQQLSQNRIKANIINALLPGKASWNPHNASCWKTELLRINGFDERLNQAQLVADLSSRLYQNEVKGMKIDFNAICLHLNSREEKKKKAVASAALPSIKALRPGSRAWTQYGIYKGRTIPVPYSDLE